MNRRTLTILVGSIIVAALAVGGIGITLAGSAGAPPTPGQGYGGMMGGFASGATITHEQMDQMMETMHGEGTSQRMHEAMGPDAEKLMDQCVTAMGTMQNMQGMMGSGATSGMMGGQNGQSMSDLMNRIMGR